MAQIKSPIVWMTPKAIQVEREQAMRKLIAFLCDWDDRFRLWRLRSHDGAITSEFMDDIIKRIAAGQEP